MPPPSLGLPQTFYALDDTGGSFCRYSISKTQLADVDAQIRSLAQDTQIFMPNFTKVAGQNIHLSIGSKVITIVGLMPKLRVSTWFQVDPAPRRGGIATATPRFMEDVSCVRMDPMWTPPANMRLFFASHFTPSGGVWLFSQSSLVTVCMEKGHTAHFKFPFPNIHENGKLCLGAGRDHTSANAMNLTMLDLFGELQSGFQRSPWNADLLIQRDFDMAKQLVRFDANKPEVQLESTLTDWFRHFTKINNVFFAGIPFHTLT